MVCCFIVGLRGWSLHAGHGGEAPLLETSGALEKAMNIVWKNDLETE